MVTETETETEVMKGRVMNFPENQLGWGFGVIVGKEEEVGMYDGKGVDGTEEGAKDLEGLSLGESLGAEDSEGLTLGSELKLGCSLGLELGCSLGLELG